MKRFTVKNTKEITDTESGHGILIWDKEMHCFIDYAEEVAAGLNLVQAIKLRRGSSGSMSRIEFTAMRAAWLEMQESDPGNPLIRDIVKLHDLISSHQDKIHFST